MCSFPCTSHCDPETIYKHQASLSVVRDGPQQGSHTCYRRSLLLDRDFLLVEHATRAEGSSSRKPAALRRRLVELFWDPRKHPWVFRPGHGDEIASVLSTHLQVQPSPTDLRGDTHRGPSHSRQYTRCHRSTLQRPASLTGKTVRTSPIPDDAAGVPSSSAKTQHARGIEIAPRPNSEAARKFPKTSFIELPAIRE